MSMKQKGWERALINYIGSKARASFKPGTLDCGLFFADAVLAMTGVDIAPKLRGKYRTIKAAYKILNGMGFANHVEYVASLYEEVPPLMAQRGDGAVGLDVDGEPALGIVQGEMCYFMTLQGLTLVPITQITRAFRI